MESWSHGVMLNSGPQHSITPSLQYSGYLDLRMSHATRTSSAPSNPIARRLGAKTALLCGRGQAHLVGARRFCASGFARDLSTQGVVAGDRVAHAVAQRSRVRRRVFGDSQIGRDAGASQSAGQRRRARCIQGGSQTEIKHRSDCHEPRLPDQTMDRRQCALR